MRPSLVSCLLVAIAICCGAVAVAAQTPTPAPSVPARPTDVRTSGGALRWTDNADNEHGYLITIGIWSDLTQDLTEVEYWVDADVTSFILPPETRLRCPDRTMVSYEVAAFNEAGVSDSDGVSGATLCPVPGTPPDVLPSTGSGPGDTTLLRTLWRGLLVLGAASFLVGGLFAVRQRR